MELQQVTKTFVICVRYVYLCVYMCCFWMALRCLTYKCLINLDQSYARLLDKHIQIIQFSRILKANAALLSQLRQWEDVGISAASFAQGFELQACAQSQRIWATAICTICCSIPRWGVSQSAWVGSEKYLCPCLKVHTHILIHYPKFCGFITRCADALLLAHG